MNYFQVELLFKLNKTHKPDIKIVSKGKKKKQNNQKRVVAKTNISDVLPCINVIK